MTHPKGILKVTAGGVEYTLFVGMSVLADLQSKHGQDVLERVEEAVGANKTPPLAVLTDLFLGALERYHGKDVDRWVVDDIIAENADAFPRLMGATLPDAQAKPGNGKRPKKAAA